MSYIPFKMSGNRLYIDLELYKTNDLLREYINRVNANRPGTFTIDMINRRVWFYPPESYVMPSLGPSTPLKERELSPQLDK